MQKKEFILISLIFLMFLASIALYPNMPEKIPMHWNAKGNIDDYSGRGFGLFFMPLFLAIIYLFFLIIPKIEVFKKNINEFNNKYFFGFKLIFVLFFLVIYLAIILSAKGYSFNIKIVILPALAVMFFYIGYMLKYVKRNFFIGIRTPWTLSSDKVWKKTHELGSRVFYAIAILTLISLFTEKGFFIFIIGLLVAVIYLFLYSYLEFKKLKKR